MSENRRVSAEHLIAAHGAVSRGEHGKAAEHLKHSRTHHEIYVRDLKQGGNDQEAAEESAAFARLESYLQQRMADGQAAKKAASEPPAQKRPKWLKLIRGKGDTKKSESVPAAPKAPMAPSYKQSTYHPDWKQSSSKLKAGSIVNFEHAQHGTVSVVHNKDAGTFDVKHNGGMAGLKGQKGSFKNPTEALAHAGKYLSAVTNGTVAGRRMQNFPSGAASAVHAPGTGPSAALRKPKI